MSQIRKIVVQLAEINKSRGGSNVGGKVVISLLSYVVQPMAGHKRSIQENA